MLHLFVFDDAKIDICSYGIKSEIPKTQNISPIRIRNRGFFSGVANIIYNSLFPYNVIKRVYNICNILATPSSSTVEVTTSAAALTSSLALPIATPMPA